MNELGRPTACAAARAASPRLVVATVMSVTAVFLGGGCTESELVTELEPRPFRDDKISVVGDLCTSSPESRVFPLRVLFVIDSSESMRVTDPADPVTLLTGRERAFQDTWQTLLEGDREGVRIGLVQFSADAQGRTLQDLDGDTVTDTYFTASRTLLADATAGLQVTGRTTNYLGALNETFVAIRTELVAADKESLPLSRYVVIFVSDGIPDVDSEEEEDTLEEQIVEAVEDIRELAELFRVGGFEFHTAYLSAGEGPSVDQEAQRLLQQMAEVGGGNFRSFPSGESLNFVFVDLTSIRRVFTLRSLAVTNLNVIVDDDQVAEFLFADVVDPFSPDGGVDGGPYEVRPRDRFDDVRPSIVDGGALDGGPRDGGPEQPSPRNFSDQDGDEAPKCGEPLVDTDGDGLSDLIEKRIARDDVPLERMMTPWLTPDTDDDGLRDRLEWSLASSGLDPLAAGDSGCFVPEPCLAPPPPRGVVDPRAATRVPNAVPRVMGSTSARDTVTYGCACVIDLRTVVPDATSASGFTALPTPDGVCDACDELADPEDAFFCLEGTGTDSMGAEVTRLYDCVDRDAVDPETGLSVGDGFCDCVDRDDDGWCDWLDRDGDLLGDCEEIYYGTAQNGNDTDADGMPDYIETRLESNPIEDDALDDNDFDRTVNSLEVRAGTDPWCDDAAIRSRVSYRYDQTTEGFAFADGGLLDAGMSVPFEPIDGALPDAGAGSGLVSAQSCYRFDVGNVTILPTEPNADARYPGNGWNRILLWAGEVAFDDPDAFAFFRIACAMVFYEPDGNFRNPPSGRLQFSDEDFVDARDFDADVHCRWP